MVPGVPGRHQNHLSLAHTRKCITYRKSLNAPLSSQTCLPLLEIKQVSLGDILPFDKNIVSFLLVELRWLNEKPYTWDNMEKKISFPLTLSLKDSKRGSWFSVKHQLQILSHFGEV